MNKEVEELGRSSGRSRLAATATATATGNNPVTASAGDGASTAVVVVRCGALQRRIVTGTGTSTGSGVLHELRCFHHTDFTLVLTVTCVAFSPCCVAGQLPLHRHSHSHRQQAADKQAAVWMQLNSSQLNSTQLIASSNSSTRSDQNNNVNS